jgi:hypothetical protein
MSDECSSCGEQTPSRVSRAPAEECQTSRQRKPSLTAGRPRAFNRAWRLLVRTGTSATVLGSTLVRAGATCTCACNMQYRKYAIGYDRR